MDCADYATSNLLVSAIVAKADYNCPAGPEAFASLGPLVQQEVAYELSRNRKGLINNSHQLAPIVSQMGGQGAIITDDEISSAPQATPLGSTDPRGGLPASAFTDGQIDAANQHPINWAHPLTIQGRRVNRQDENEQFLPAVVTRSAHTQQPGTPWGFPSGSTPGWCGPTGAALQQNGWGKLFLFLGLGLIAVGCLQNER